MSKLSKFIWWFAREWLCWEEPAFRNLQVFTFCFLIFMAILFSFFTFKIIFSPLHSPTLYIRVTECKRITSVAGSVCEIQKVEEALVKRILKIREGRY